jgi:hypothetical protein
MLKEVLTAEFKELFQNLTGGTDKHHVSERIYGLHIKIKIWDLLKIKQES